ncbi:unnamed protein product [Caenorhabditis nigoni]
MEEAWKVVKDHFTPIFLKPLKFRDMTKEQKNEALRDATARVIFILLLPYILSILISFSIGVSSMILLNELIAKLLGSYDSKKLLRRGCVVLSGSTVLGSCLLFSTMRIVPSIYQFLFSIIGFY